MVAGATVHYMRADRRNHAAIGAAARGLRLPLIRRDAVARRRIRETADARGAFQAELERLGLTARSDVEISKAEAAADIAELLAVKPGTKVLTRRRRMYANDIPLQLAVSYLPLDIANGTALTEADTGPGGTYSRLAGLGHAPATNPRLAREHATPGELHETASPSQHLPNTCL
jgi:GntR family transcriptional regulator